ncbi:helix-turn-helix domain-containing protein [Planctomicrobium sp. SH664]|uniref:helix-turn-helix domain-containing protein n=1 Tax=Planctomicrobium sp. SH664 TaxID=3448125 RepID=UPI003F5BB513
MLLTLKQVAEHLQVSTAHIKRLVKVRELEALDISLAGTDNVKLRIPSASLERFIEARTFKRVPRERQRSRIREPIPDYFTPSPPTKTGRRRLSIYDASQILGATELEVEQIIRNGHLKMINGGGSGMRICERELAAFLERCRSQTSSPWLSRVLNEKTRCGNVSHSEANFQTPSV